MPAKDKEIAELIDIFEEKIKPFSGILNADELSAVLTGLEDYFDSFHTIKESLLKIKDTDDMEIIEDESYMILFEFLYHIAPHIEALEGPMFKMLK